MAVFFLNVVPQLLEKSWTARGNSQQYPDAPLLQRRARTTLQRAQTHKWLFLSFFFRRQKLEMLPPFPNQGMIKKKKNHPPLWVVDCPRPLLSLSLTGFPRTSLTLTCITASFHLPSLTSFNWRINLSTCHQFSTTYYSTNYQVAPAYIQLCI